MATFFNDHFDIDPNVVEEYGAYNVSLITDLPLFIDPFLLFNSENAEYRALHDRIIEYLLFLKQKSALGSMSDALLRSWYCFPEVKQTWLGFSEFNNSGRGLGLDFARVLHSSLHELFREFGEEKITRGSHLEKVCLIKEGVGRDNISDFTTNLIKEYLYTYTEQFALAHLQATQCKRVAIRRVTFNYKTETWSSRQFTLPWANGDHVVLTPSDILTRDENWISRHDLISDFEKIPVAIPDAQLRAQVSNYFHSTLKREKDKEPTKKDIAAAASATIHEFPEIIDYYIRMKEESGGEAASISAEKIQLARLIFNEQIQQLQALLGGSPFYGTTSTTYEEAHARLGYLKDVIENKGGHRSFYGKNGEPIRAEEDLQVMYRLVWFGTPSDVSREANDGRGPADFKVSRGARDKTIVEMKLAKNTQLKRNLQKQAEIYQKASDAMRAIKAIVFFTEDELARVRRILKELGLGSSKDVVLIDARSDNKPSGSKA